jgi:hypothetical protein
MKRRAFQVLNFFAFNLLFFALYLNFIHKDKNVQEAIQASNAIHFNTTVSVQDVEQPNAESNEANETKASGKAKEAPVKQSFN